MVEFEMIWSTLPDLYSLLQFHKQACSACGTLFQNLLSLSSLLIPSKLYIGYLAENPLGYYSVKVQFIYKILLMARTLLVTYTVLD